MAREEAIDTKELTPLEQPKKVRFSGVSRSRVYDRIHPEENTVWGCSLLAFTEQKTQLVFRYYEQLDDFLKQTAGYDDPQDRIWLDGQQSKAIRRVRQTVSEFREMEK